MNVEIKSRNKKSNLILFITALIMILISIVSYSTVAKPKFYSKFMDLGHKYLQNCKYEEAILVFDKAIKIDEKSTGARVGLAKGYVGTKEFDKATDILIEAQELDLTNENLLIEILDILKDIDQDRAKEVLDKYIQSVGNENISQVIKDIQHSPNQEVEHPNVYPEPGTYLKPIDVKITTPGIKLGHTYYYTTDGSYPDRNSQEIEGGLKIDKNTSILIVGYSEKGKSEYYRLDYIIDSTIVDKVKRKISEAEMLYKDTTVGTNPGNCVEGSKDKFDKAIKNAKNDLIGITKNKVSGKIVVEKLENEIKLFEANIIQQTNKTKLKSLISQADQIYNGSVEGSNDGQYKIGSKQILLNTINEVKKVNDNILSRQDDIDSAVSILNSALNTFKTNKNSSFTKEMALKYIISEFGEEVDDELTGQRRTYEIIGGLKYEDGKAYYEVEMFDITAGFGTYDPDTRYYVYEDGDIYMPNQPYEGQIYD